MHIFKRAFRQMMRQKNRIVYLFLLIQVVSALIISIISWSSSGSGHLGVYGFYGHTSITGFAAYTTSYADIFSALDLLAFLAFWIWSSWQNVRLNRSQSWRLLPLSDNKLLSANLFSSLLSFIWLLVLELVVTLLAFLPLISNEHLIRAVNKALLGMSRYNWQELGHATIIFLQFAIIAILIGLGWYLTVNLLDFLSRTINNFTPVRRRSSSRALLWLFRLLILILIIVLFAHLGDFIDLFLQGKWWTFSGMTANLWLIILEFAVFDIVVYLVDLFLFGHFFEAKQDD